MKKQAVGMMVAFVVLASGCSAGARVVRTGGGGGELTMWGPVVPAARHGREALIEYCGGDYLVSPDGQALGLTRTRATLAEPHRSTPAASGDATRSVRFRCKRSSTLAAR